MSASSNLVERIARMATDSPSEFPVRGAVATFLFKVMPVDGQTHPKEIDRLTRILCDDFALTTDEALDLISHAKQQDNSLEALTRLAGILKDNVDRSDLITLISHMWEMVFADGRMHETEILFVERVAVLLDVPQTDVSRAMGVST